VSSVTRVRRVRAGRQSGLLGSSPRVDSETQPLAPAVVAVVITCDPGSWLEPCLSSLAVQDYPNLSVLVIDSASEEDPTPRVTALLPGAAVTRLPRRLGFGRAANEALKRVEGASHLLFCHDDVALAPDAVRALVEEAFRSNAGIATPKYLQWDHPDRLLAVGASADKVGVVQDLVEPGELDQEQHDVVREVFVAPGGATLVRADLFRVLGGFNATIDQFGEDLDLSWRARVAGARVVTVPAARVGHLQALRRGLRAGWEEPARLRAADRLADRHRVRTVLTCYRWYVLAWIAPLAAFYLLGESATRLLQGRPGDAAHAVGSLFGALRSPRRLWRSRRRVQRRRVSSDAEIRRLQTRGNARFRAFVRARVEGVREGLPPAPLAGRGGPLRAGAAATVALREAAGAVGAATAGTVAPLTPAVATAGGPGTQSDGTERPGAWRTAVQRPAVARPAGQRPGGEAPAFPGSDTWWPVEAADNDPFGVEEQLDDVDLGPQERPWTQWRPGLIVGGAILIVLIFGSRSLLDHGLPAIGQLPSTSGGWSGLWRSWWSPWQLSGLGVSAPSSPALALLGILGTVLFGAMGTLQHVVVLGPLVIGPLGAYRAARWWGSRRGRLVALVAYAVVPVPYNALAKGDWAGLLAYAAAPWVLGAVGRLSGEVPYPATPVRRTVGRVLGLGLLVAIIGAAAPSYLFTVPIVGAALLAGSLLAGRARRGLQMFGVALGATVVGAVLLLPWSSSVLGSRVASLGVDPGPAARLSFGQVLRFDTGPIGHGPLDWAFLVVAALPLVIGRGWRLAWAGRLWAVAIVFYWVTWAGLRGWIPALPVEVGLAPAAAALAGSAALGVAAFELDLPGYRFGWRQLAATAAGFALCVATIPMLVASTQGRWNLPSADASSVLAFLPGANSGDYRVLWVGAPGALPLASRQLDPGVGFATSYDGEPGPADLWIPGRQGAMPVLASDLRLAENGLTTRLGHLLAPMAVRFIVVPNHNGPSGSGAAAVPAPNALLAGLQLQTDLDGLNVDPNYTVYENAAWAPARAVLPPSALPATAGSASAGARSLQETDLTAAAPVLTGGSPSVVRGQVPAGSTVYVSATRDPGWRLHVGSASVAPVPAFGWAMSFPLPADAGGAATLQLRPPWDLRAAQIVEILLWLAVIAVVGVDLRRRRAEYPQPETVRPEWFTRLSPAVIRPGWRRAGKGPLGAADLEGDEVWLDG
jgi:GT2 family glycosyltransferase